MELSAGEPSENEDRSPWEIPSSDLPPPAREPEVSEYRLDVPEVEEPDCGSLDVLFVIDNSGSMDDDQFRLSSNLDPFIRELEEAGIGFKGGIHIGVVTTDAYEVNQEGCQMLGSLVTQVGDSIAESVSEVCTPYSSGLRFMTELDNLEESFVCAAQPGKTGSAEERPVDAMLEALDGWLNRPGGCNEGFHRPEASLVVVMVTDEDDISSAESPEVWAEHLKYLRMGDLEDTAVLGLLPLGDCAEYDEKLNLETFIESIPNGYIGDICEASYEGFFENALNTVKKTCHFEPVP